jgi:intracellular septation protein A
VSTLNPAQKNRENPWLNLALNILLPALIMMKGKGIGDKAGFDPPPALVLGIALVFPLAYGLYDFFVRRKTNFYSILGFVSILITGGVGLFRLDKDWIAIKEAAVPAIFGLAVLATSKTRRPLVKLFLFNNDIFDVSKIEHALKSNQAEAGFDRLIFRSTLLLAASFLFSAILNFALARYFIHSETGTAAFNEELGRMTLWSWFVIAVPSLAVFAIVLWKVFTGIQNLTGLELEAMFRNEGGGGPVQDSSGNGPTGTV